MANTHKGQREVEIRGEKYTLEFTMNALVGVEELFEGKSLSEIRFDTKDLTVRQYRRLIYLALHDNHPELEEEEVGKLVNLSTMAETVTLLFEVIGGTSEAVDEAGNARKPAKAGKAEKEEPAGTGAK